MHKPRLNYREWHIILIKIDKITQIKHSLKKITSGKYVHECIIRGGGDVRALPPHLLINLSNGMSITINSDSR
jgi:hypothetical protein